VQDTPESQRQLYENATFLPLCWLFTHTHTLHTHLATDVEAVRQKPKAKANAEAQNLLHKLWQQILAQTIFSWFRRSQPKGSGYILVVYGWDFGGTGSG